MPSRFPNAQAEASGSWSAPTMTSNPFSTPSSTANAAAAAASSSHTTSRSFRPRLPWPPISGIPIMSALFVARSTVLPRHLPSSTQPTDRSRSPRLWYRPPLSRPHRSARWINGSSASPLSAIASWLQLSASNLSQPVRFHDKSLRQPTFDAEVTNPTDCQALVDFAARSFGRIDVLFNNAAMAYFNWLEDITDEEWNRDLREEIDLVFFLTRAAWPHLRSEE